MKEAYDVVVIGSGPAGLGVGLRLHDARLNKQKSNHKVAIIDSEARVAKGGLTNDCKLNLAHDRGIKIDKLGITEDKADAYIAYIKQRFLDVIPDLQFTGESEGDDVKNLRDIAAKHGVDFRPAFQTHVGTDRSIDVINSLYNQLTDAGTTFLMGTKVEQVERNGNGLFDLVIADGASNDVISARNVVLAPGRAGTEWLRTTLTHLGVEYGHSPVDIGIRFEVPAGNYRHITQVNRCPKFVFSPNDPSNRVKTFCTNEGGRVRREPRHSGGFHLVNGDAMSRNDSGITNFALLATVTLTEPASNTTRYAEWIGRAVDELGNGKPVIQRWGDIGDNRRSKRETFFEYTSMKPTLPPPKVVTPGDLQLAYPYKIWLNLMNALNGLNRIVKDTAPRGNFAARNGILVPEACVYGPEIKFCNTTVQTRTNLETSLDGLYVAGDVIGVSKGIVGAFISGFVVAEGLENRLK